MNSIFIKSYQSNRGHASPIQVAPAAWRCMPWTFGPPVLDTTLTVAVRIPNEDDPGSVSLSTTKPAETASAIRAAAWGAIKARIDRCGTSGVPAPR